MSNKQCICPECGHVAEIRRQKNGKFLRYMVCKHGHGGLMTRKDNDTWAEIEQDNIGTFGELPPKEQKEETQPEKQDLEIASDDYEPESDDSKEVEANQPKQGKDNAKNEEVETGGGLPVFVKVGLGALCLALGGGAFYLNKIKKG